MDWKKEIERLDKIKKKKGISNYQIAKKIEESRQSVGHCFLQKYEPRVSMYLKIKEYLES